MIKITKERTTANSTYPKVGVSFSADTFVVTESLYLRMKVCAIKSTPSQSGKTL